MKMLEMVSKTMVHISELDVQMLGLVAKAARAGADSL